MTRKFNPGTGAYITIEGATVTQGEFGGYKFVATAYSIDDNGPLDLNAEEGIITDPVGLGQVLVGAPRTGGGGTAK